MIPLFKKLRAIKFISTSLCATLLFMHFSCFGLDLTSMPSQWTTLNKIMVSRHDQTALKMKLTTQQIDSLILFLKTLHSHDLIELQKLQKVLPKTTLELLFAIQARGVDKGEAEKMAAYLQQVPKEYHIKNVAAFDENTSHIIGREWHEINYSGEGMTWEGQKAKYAPYNITSFKTLNNLKKFFPVESKLPYFNQVYQS